MSYSWSYAAVYEAQYTGSLHKIVLPFCRDERYGSLSFTPDYSTFIKVVNATSTSNELKIAVRHLDNSSFSTPDPKSVTLGTGVSFSLSAS